MFFYKYVWIIIGAVLWVVWLLCTVKDVKEQLEYGSFDFWDLEVPSILFIILNTLVLFFSSLSAYCNSIK